MDTFVYRYTTDRDRLWNRIARHYELFDRSLIGNCQTIFGPGPDSSFLLVTHDEALAQSVLAALPGVIDNAPEPRRSNLRSVFGTDGFGAVVITDTIEQSVEVVNRYAPEHLLIWCNEPNRETAVQGVRNTGEILIGPHTTFAAANYAIGITAVLPTNGFAKRFSGITCKDMLTFSSYAELDLAALEKLGPAIQAIGEYEGLPGHVAAVSRRLDR